MAIMRRKSIRTNRLGENPLYSSKSRNKKIVSEPEAYYFSSVGNYADLDNVLDWK